MWNRPEPVSARDYCIPRDSKTRRTGLVPSIGGQVGNVVRIKPPLVISDAALDRALDVVEDALGVVSRT
jgi:4-aminobutyrate aminotransferase-like enzyme